MGPAREAARSGVNNIINGCCHCCDIPLALVFGLLFWKNSEGTKECNEQLWLAGMLFAGYWVFWILRNILFQFSMYCCKLRPEWYGGMFLIRSAVFLVLDGIALGIITIWALGIYQSQEAIECNNTIAQANK